MGLIRLNAGFQFLFFLILSLQAIKVRRKRSCLAVVTGDDGAVKTNVCALHRDMLPSRPGDGMNEPIGIISCWRVGKGKCMESQRAES
jgi:hypothetical protein